MSNIYGRQVVEPLVNKSGGSVAAGDVVVIDTTNDGAFTTTTTGRAEITVGIAQETIANNATGRILLSGYAALVNVPSSVTRGHYVETYTVAKQATGNSTRRSGSFGQFRTGGTTPTAVLWGSTDQTAGGGATAAVSGVVRFGASDITTASTTFVDLTGASITLTTGAHRVLLMLNFFTYNSGAFSEFFTFTVDGTEVSSRSNGLYQNALGASGSGINSGSLHFLTDVLSAGSHTFKVQWKVNGGTGTFYGNASNQMATFSAMEQPS